MFVWNRKYLKYVARCDRCREYDKLGIYDSKSLVNSGWEIGQDDSHFFCPACVKERETNELDKRA